ncbi:hypothetical protein ANAPC5_01481 [Anaplasma phagocytophilum]|nr:hypothetical protein ANAPC5_01481 [Anaplasma phagocytophilum]
MLTQSPANREGNPVNYREVEANIDNQDKANFVCDVTDGNQERAPPKHLGANRSEAEIALMTAQSGSLAVKGPLVLSLKPCFQLFILVLGPQVVLAGLQHQLKELKTRF